MTLLLTGSAGACFTEQTTLVTGPYTKDRHCHVCASPQIGTVSYNVAQHKAAECFQLE